MSNSPVKQYVSRKTLQDIGSLVLELAQDADPMGDEETAAAAQIVMIALCYRGVALPKGVVPKVQMRAQEHIAARRKEVTLAREALRAAARHLS